MIRGLGRLIDKEAERLKNLEKKIDLEAKFDCTIHATVNIWRHSLNEKPEVVEFLINKYACRNWTWKEIEAHLRFTRFEHDSEGRFVDLNVAAIKLVSAWKDITDKEKQVSWHEIMNYPEFPDSSPKA